MKKPQLIKEEDFTKNIFDWISNSRFCVILFLCCMLFAGTKSFSQSKGISLDLKNVSIEQVLNEIESKSNYRFLYNKQLVEENQKVSIIVSDKSVSFILDKIFDNTGITYIINNNQIVLTKKESTSAKKIKISGVVKSKGDGSPLPGVSIVEKGTNHGTQTDFDGKFSLEVKNEKAVLIFSYVGYRNYEEEVGNKSLINIALQEDTQSLNEVVVVGYGVQKKKKVLGSIATIKSDELTVTPVASTTNALAGRLPGLITKQQSGLPGGDSSSLSIRGFGAPLVIVDGVQSSFNDIDANEIESISVLKDASAAIYGARAGDGVILVTTKRGSNGKPTIKFQSSMTFQGVTNMPKLASSGQQAEMLREEHTNKGLPESTQRFTQQEVDLFYAGTNPDYPNTDWLKVVSRDWAPQQQHNLSVSGGSDKIKYYGFLGTLDQKSMFTGNSFQYNRYNLRSNIDAKILDNLSLQVDISSIWGDQTGPWRLDQDANSIWQEYWASEPFWNPTLPDGRLAYAGTSSIGFHYMVNKDLSGYKTVQTQNFKGTLSLKYDFKQIEGLSAKVFGNLNQDYSFYKQFYWLADSWSYNYSADLYTLRTSKTDPTLTNSDSRGRQLTGQFSLDYHHIFGENHDVGALALYESIDTNSQWITAQRIGYKTTAIDYLFAGGLANQFADGRASQMGRQSFIGRLNYGYKSKYLTEATIRIDESAKFRKDQRRGYFPSFMLGWNIAEEGFMKNNFANLDNLKLRTSYSQTGKDDVGDFKYLSGYQYGNTYLMGSTATQGLISTGLPNPFLTWEKMTIYNAGLDFSFYKRKLYGNIDVFYRNREGIPGQSTQTIPDSFGATLPTVNLNTINTRGFELVIGHEGHLNDLKWSAQGNLSWSRSKWGFYDEPTEWGDADLERINKKTGNWTDRSFGYISDGLFTSQEEIDNLDFVYDQTNGNAAIKPGDIRYKDLNHDGILNWRDVAEIGRGTSPHWIAGLNLNLTYKNFDISTFFQGGFAFNQNIILRRGNNYSELIYNERWTPENNRKDALVSRLGGAGTNSATSDFNVKKSDYIRLKTLSLGYSFPKSLLQKINVQSLRIYLSGMNLFTLSGMNKYSVDPEAPNGLSGYYYPQMRTISYGLNLSF